MTYADLAELVRQAVRLSDGDGAERQVKEPKLDGRDAQECPGGSRPITSGAFRIPATPGAEFGSGRFRSLLSQEQDKGEFESGQPL